MAGDPRAIGALATARQGLGVSLWPARVMDEYLKEGLLEPHLIRTRAIYKAKATTAVKAMREHCTPYVKFREPRGSFYLWVEIDNRVDWPRAARLAEREGIVFRPGERFSSKHSGRQFLRLAYSHISEQAIADGIAKLGSILRACARH
jgi:2-aminoadipate transaminase